jgi:hypothetical protein
MSDRALICRMVELYNADPSRVAGICDEQLDRSGNLLGDSAFRLTA